MTLRSIGFLGFIEFIELVKPNKRHKPKTQSQTLKPQPPVLRFPLMTDFRTERA